ncbi:hypothetical protein C4K03_2993 [Pseudomonas synxantha]|uniref:Uncharacterized protein n=1 Tax=Pseudomonas synxantha TaxID=47883 RepID=A0A3G7U978_9PSED|nr:hypothetical protein [Pseudomonas synxantha]AZE55148.1 hypothetical protein C4K03_2993 [Pseudomonas synxantha]
MSSILGINNRLLLLALLLPVSTWVFANESEVVGNWWIVHSDDAGPKNIMYIADGTTVMPSKKTSGAQLVEVTKVYAEKSKPLSDDLNIEVQCAKHRVRFLNGTSVERQGNKRHELKVSGQWQNMMDLVDSGKDMWLLKSFAFVCQPANRKVNGMIPLGNARRAQALKSITEIQAPPKSVMEELDEMLGNGE